MKTKEKQQERGEIRRTLVAFLLTGQICEKPLEGDSKGSEINPSLDLQDKSCAYWGKVSLPPECICQLSSQFTLIVRSQLSER